MQTIGRPPMLGTARPANPNAPPIFGTQPVRLETVTDEGGNFQISGLAAGPYRVQAVGDDLAAVDVDRQITLTAGERVLDLVLRLTDTVLVEGTVRRAGAPAANVWLSFEVQGTPKVPEGHTVLYPWAVSGPDGRFQIRLKRGAIVERILGAWPRKSAPPGFVVSGKMSGLEVAVP